MPTFTDDLRVAGYGRLVSPRRMKEDIPVSAQAGRTVVESRRAIQRVLERRDPRLLLVVGPCSIHEEQSALEYAERLRGLQQRVAEVFLVVMRVYFEKPRTTVGWKGFINDPRLDGSCDLNEGLRRARLLLLRIQEMGLPAGTEMVEMVTPQYLADLVSWGAIGARTAESPAHRALASGLSMPVGIKNGTDGNILPAIHALIAARTPQSFLGVDPEGYTAVVRTKGNPACHLVLRGGRRPNYDPLSIAEARLSLIAHGLPETLLVDCSHGNSWKKHQGQEIAWKSVIEQRLAGTGSLVGLMLESHLREGNQPFRGKPEGLAYGVSITDECISWETTERVVLEAAEELAAGPRRLAAGGGSAA